MFTLAGDGDLHVATPPAMQSDLYEKTICPSFDLRSKKVNVGVSRRSP